MDCTLKTIFADLTFTLELVMIIAKYTFMYIYMYIIYKFLFQVYEY